VSRIQIYIDEDAMDSDLAAALRSRGITVLAAMEAALVERSDDEQWCYAVEQGVRFSPSMFRTFTGFTPNGLPPVGNMRVLYLRSSSAFRSASYFAASCDFVPLLLPRGFATR
jgi:hypothetical protein